MFKKSNPTWGVYELHEKAVLCVCIAIVFSVLPYFFLYCIITPLLSGNELSLTTVAVLIALTALCMVGNALLYVKDSAIPISAHTTH